jgi:mono/diheme cytochrome c family protein
MVRLRRVLFLGFLGLSATLAACSDDDDGGPLDPGPTPVSYASEIQPIFDASCVRCHGEGGSGGLDLRPGDSHGNLVGVISQNYAPAVLVVAGEPTDSVLYEKIADTGRFGGVMPPGAGALPDEEIALIRRWIEEGANP